MNKISTWLLGLEFKSDNIMKSKTMKYVVKYVFEILSAYK